MIDWWYVAANSLWIVGLSGVLAAFSYHDWLAKTTRRGCRDVFKARSFRLPWTSGMCLACLGWGGGETVWWERALLLLLAAWFAREMLRLVTLTIDPQSGTD